jgi:hypothetical protein
VQEGQTIALGITATDDAQVRSVQLIVNGVARPADVAYPWDLAVALPSIADNGGNQVTLQVRATDSGGNTALSELVTLDLVPDTIAPQLLSASIANGATVNEGLSIVRFVFDEPMANIPPGAVTIRTADGTIVVPDEVILRDNGQTLQLRFPALAIGQYTLLIDQTALTDRAANPLGAAIDSRTFDVVQTSDIGYYSMQAGQGVAGQVAEIELAGFTPILIDNPNAAQLATVAALYVNNESNDAFTSEFTANLPDIFAAVQNGLVLVIHDRRVSAATSILPGLGATLQIVRDFGDDSDANLSADAGVKIAIGPGGVIDNSTLDGGNSTSHGYIDVTGITDTLDVLLTRADSNRAITVGYKFGNGYVVYSTIPLDFYTSGGSGGITDAEANTYAANVLAYAIGVARGTIDAADPIVVDLDGDGVHFLASDHSVRFDLDTDGNAEALSWFSPHDGILVLDANRSGVIEDGSEVVSEHFLGQRFASSLEALASLDTNGDGEVSRFDDAFAALGIWVDANSDGITQGGELRSLVDAGIASFALGATPGFTAVDNQLVVGTGTFAFDSGQVGAYAAAHLAGPIRETTPFDAHPATGSSTDALVLGEPDLVNQGLS